MFVRAKKKTENRWQVQIVETNLVSGKPRQKIVRNIGTAHNKREVDDFKAVGESIIIEMKNAQQPVLSFADPSEFHAPAKRKTGESVNIKSLREIKRLNQGYEAVMKPLFDDMALDLGDEEANETIGSLVLARAFKPSSKLQAKKTLEKHFDRDIPLHKIYRAIDRLADNEMSVKQAITKKTFDLFSDRVDIMFFDVTTLAFESQVSGDLKDFGYSKD